MTDNLNMLRKKKKSKNLDAAPQQPEYSDISFTTRSQNLSMFWVIYNFGPWI